MEQEGGLERLLEVFWSCSAPVGLRSGDAVSRGDHRPMKDLLVATGVIAPDPLAQGMVVIVGNGLAQQTHVPQGFLLPDDTIDVKSCEGVKLEPPSTTDTPGQ